MKRERGKYNILHSLKKKKKREDGLPSLTISIESSI